MCHMSSSANGYLIVACCLSLHISYLYRSMFVNAVLSIATYYFKFFFYTFILSNLGAMPSSHRLGYHSKGRNGYSVL